MNKLPKNIKDKKSAREYVKKILKSLDEDLVEKKLMTYGLPFLDIQNLELQK